MRSVSESSASAPASKVGAEFVRLGRATFLMGTDSADGYPDDGEGPMHEVALGPFEIDRRAVSNRRFAAFVEATGHQTEAERFGWSFVFGGFLPDDFPPTRAVASAPWWRQVEEADWRHPDGPQSDLTGRENHPVVHVSWVDAQSYCNWAGKKLPTEAEWEFAARGGLESQAFPWGNELEPEGGHMMNVWQGSFPDANSLGDGYFGTCPVDAFDPNAYGLLNTTGNVWEWTGDWFHASFRPRDKRTDPAGPPNGTNKVQKGGSYLCHHSYCRRYRVAARQGNTPDSSTGNLGFRCARDA